jgi:hypothetical protein
MNTINEAQFPRPLILFIVVAIAWAAQGQHSQLSTVSQPPATTAAEQLIWPREFDASGVKAVLFQPEIEKWDGVNIEMRSAVAITQYGSNAPVFGVFWTTARADIDKATRIVTLENVVVTRAKFPSQPGSEAVYLTILREQAPVSIKTIALDHLEAEYAISKAEKKARAVSVRNTPPSIIYSAVPSLLVLVDGPAILRPIPGSDIERVINTPALLLKEGGRFYLYAADNWYDSTAIGGVWNLATNVPASLDQTRQAEMAKSQVDLIPPGTNTLGRLLTVYVSAVPAELIQTEGVANLVPIEGTGLMQVENCDHALFQSHKDNAFYVLISGRWFKSSSLQGSWTYLPYNKLPSDFAKIPPTNPRANALVSVPGTPQAKEALIANTIPQTATVQRNQATLRVSYDGTPSFKPIPETSLQYAVNTQTPVIEEKNSYFAIENGIWFTAPFPSGPWQVATNVPSSIYGIPVSSPLHYVTYAQIYGFTPEVVYTGYTPGYLGAITSPDHVVVYGTGWDYPHYIGNYWVGGPCTYGFGAAFADNWTMGFGFGFTSGIWLGAWEHPWWGPYGWGWRHEHRYDRASFNHISIYSHWNHGVTGETHPYEFHDGDRRESAHDLGRSSHPLPVAGIEHNHATAPDHFRQHVFSGRDGSVVRNNPSGGWERSAGPAWHSVPHASTRPLDQHAFGRTLGERRLNNFGSFGGDLMRPNLGSTHPNSGFAHNGGFPQGGGFSHLGGGFSHSSGGHHR